MSPRLRSVRRIRIFNHAGDHIIVHREHAEEYHSGYDGQQLNAVRRIDAGRDFVQCEVNVIQLAELRNGEGAWTLLVFVGIVSRILQLFVDESVSFAHMHQEIVELEYDYPAQW